MYVGTSKNDLFISYYLQSIYLGRVGVYYKLQPFLGR